MTRVDFAPGTIITARRRLWRVDGQPEDDVLVATTIDGGDARRVKFYVPFETIAPGRVAPPASDRVGSPAAQELLLRAHRLSLLHGSAPLLSLQRSRVIPKDYQLVPVVMALEMSRVRMLLADDVGLGKTIEAGLIATELLARQWATRMLIIVPASLREQWREALHYFFHIPARVISTRHRRAMERELPVGANPWAYYPFLITSVDYAKRPAIKHQILEQPWDIVIIDEAHQVARPHQSSPEQSVSMDRWDLARTLTHSAQVRHLLLLTATPHNGYTDTFASLLRMLDVGAIEGPHYAPRVLRDIAARYVCQRRRADVEAWFRENGERSPDRSPEDGKGWERSPDRSPAVEEGWERSPDRSPEAGKGWGRSPDRSPAVEEGWERSPDRSPEAGKGWGRSPDRSPAVEEGWERSPDRSPFPTRDQDEVIVPPSMYEKAAIDAVIDYGERVLTQAAEGPAQARTLAHWTVLHFHKRALSSPEALRCSLRNRRKRLRQRLSELQQAPAVGAAADAIISPDAARANVLDEDTGEWLTDEEVSARTERLVYGDPAQLQAELEHLQEVLAHAEKVTPNRDNKLRWLLEVVLRDLMRLDPKVVIFPLRRHDGLSARSDRGR
jgi:hypothetical protein